MFDLLSHKFSEWWHNHQRNVDIDILWPICKQNADDLTHAKVAFAVHAFNDPAWLCLGKTEIKRRIDGLK